MSPQAIQLLTLNYNSPVPLYSQLADELRRQIGQGIWQPHERIPSESELGRTYGVSRSVIRQALDELDRSGDIYLIKGKGGFVSERKLLAYLMQDARGFAADMATQRLTVQTRILKQTFIQSPPEVSEALHLPADAIVLELERLRSVRAEVLFLGTTYLPEEVGKKINAQDFTRQSLNDCLRQYAGLEATNGVRVIESVAATRREADLLQVRVGAPLFRLFAVTLSQYDQPMECSRVWMRGDRLAFRVELNCSDKSRGERGL